MFSNLFDFSFKRSLSQAVGFYIAYFVLYILIAVLVGGVVKLIAGDIFTQYHGLKTGSTLAVILSVVTALLIVWKKNLFGNLPLVVVALLSGVFALLGGTLLGLVPVAFLTTK